MRSGLLPGAESNTAIEPTRRYYLDWLRVLAMLSIFFFHNHRFFDDHFWHIKNAVTGLGSTIFVQFFNHWMMPLFFVISGAAVYYSLSLRGAGKFIKERSLRILIPLIFGIFVVAPPQVYLERLTNLQFSGSFFHFFPHYFDGLYGFGGNFAFVGMHLWYLFDLFIFSLVTLPLLLPRKKTERSLISRLSNWFERPGSLVFLCLPVAIAAMFADWAGLGFTRQMGGWDIFSYLFFFLYGYLVFSNTGIQETIKKYGTVALFAGLVLSACGLVLRFLLNPQISFGTPQYAGIMVLKALRAWCWIIAILSFGSRFLNRKSRFLRYANEAVLPFYIQHQTVILIIGFYIVQWNMGIPGKYLFISSISFAVIMAIYELLIRRIGPLRFVFGMRPKKKIA